MNVEQIATWVGLVTAIAGAAANYGITENKVATLENKMAELYNVEEIRVLERRLTTLEVSLENVKATTSTTQESIGSIETTDTSQMESDINVNKIRISEIKSQLSTLRKELKESLEKVSSNPLS